MILDPAVVSVVDFHQFLLSTVAPRPIAFASTVDEDGRVNLSPFSFFNCFSANPPILIFSPSRRVRDNTIKHTLENVYKIKEVVINIVNFNLVEQASLASTEYPEGVNEFVKSGLTEVSSIKVKPPRVKESPVSYECKVIDIVELGKGKGAGNLIVCEVVLAHYNEEILDDKGRVDPHKIDLVARMGYGYYCRASKDAVFEVPKPVTTIGIGVDQIPDFIRNSLVLTGNNLGRLGNVEQLPDKVEVQKMRESAEVYQIFNEGNSKEIKIEKIHILAKKWIEAGKVNDAWKLLLLSL